MNEPEPTHVQPTISMPSADLINFRFDQTDKNIALLDKKVVALTSTYATKEELSFITRRLDNYTWYWRTVFGFLMALTVGVVTALIEKK